MNRYLAVAAILVGASQAHAETDISPDVLDVVLKKYQSVSGDMDWVRLQHDLAARKKTAKIKSPQDDAGRPRVVVTVAPVAASTMAPIAPPPFDTKPTGVLLLRDAYSNQTFISEQDTLSDNGASLSYTRDGIANKQTIAGKGALFYAMDQWIAPSTVDPNAVRLAHYSIVPGIEWDIKSQSKLHDVSGSTSALLGAEYLVRSPWFDASYFKANASYTTDVSSGKAQVYGSEFTWQPVLLNAGIGTTRRLNRQLDVWLEFVPTLNADFFHVGDSGDFSNLIKGRDYFWAGPELSGRLFFQRGPLAPYSLFFKYYFLYDTLHGGMQNVNYSQVGAMAKLLQWKDPVQGTDTGDLSLTLRYTKGATLRTLEKNDEVFAGITLKIGSLPTAAPASDKTAN
jgi:hypothetical protein